MQELYDNIDKAYKLRHSKKRITKLFMNIENASISYELFGKSSKMAMVESKIDWEDVGDFNALFQINPLDKNSNLSESKLYAFKSSGNYVNVKKPVVLLGVNRMILIEAEDLIFLCSRKNSQKIKSILSEIDKKYL
jgi:mannose-1-phosphate guanylyltransferase